MDEIQVADDIRIFDASSRLGRVRYFAYPLLISLLVLLAGVVAGIFGAIHLVFISWILIGAAYIFAFVMQFVFMVRRLHDLNASGWWSLLYGAFFVVGAITLVGKFQGIMLTVYLLAALVVFIFALILLFAPGTQGANKFGPAPPPNSTAIVIGAWVMGIFIPLGVIGILAAIAIPAYQDYIARSQTAEGIQLAGGAEVGVSEYFQANKTWPAQLSTVYATAGQNPAGKYVATVTGSGSGNTYGVTSTMKDTGVNRMIVGKSVEIWTADGGNTWQCGPGSANPLDPKYLPASCRDTGAP